MAASRPPSDDLSCTASAAEPAPPCFRLEFAALLAVTAVAVGLRCLRTSGLPPDLGEAAHRLTANPERFFEPRAWSAALGAAAPALAWALLRRGCGPFVAFAAAAIAATTPWAAHAARSGSTVGAVFVAALFSFAALRALRPVPAAVAAIAGAALAWWAASRAQAMPESIDLAAWLAADVGLGSLAFVIAAFARPGARLRQAVVLAGAAALVAALLIRFESRSAAGAATALVVVLAADGLGGWLEVARAPALQAAALAIALVPSVPGLVSEFIDGGRFDLEPLAAAFAAQRGEGEPLFSSDPELASHEFGVDCLRIPAGAHAPRDFLPPDHAAWIVLLFDRGRALGDPSDLAPDLQRELKLVARTSRKRLDLHRYEARLYRSDPARSPP